MLRQCSPAHEFRFQSDAHKPPPFPPVPPDRPGWVKYENVKRPSEYFIPAILDALEILATIPDPQIPWLIRRYVDFPILEVAEQAQKCLEKRNNLWNRE